jgi:hypothetical protein
MAAHADKQQGRDSVSARAQYIAQQRHRTKVSANTKEFNSSRLRRQTSNRERTASAQGQETQRGSGTSSHCHRTQPLNSW